MSIEIHFPRVETAENVRSDDNFRSYGAWGRCEGCGNPLGPDDGLYCEGCDEAEPEIDDGPQR